MKNFRAYHLSSLSLTTAAVLLGFVFVAGITAAHALEGQTPEQACTPDVMRLCQEFVPDHGRIATCLAKHRSQLSSACRSVMSTPKKRQRHAER